MSRAVNPYLNHAKLSPIEQEVLWEFSKMSDNMKRISTLSRLTAESPNGLLLVELRALEKKMGLVLTLYKASVWAVVMDQQAEEEEAQAQRAARADSTEWSRT